MQTVPADPESHRPLPVGIATVLLAALYIYPGTLIAVAVHEFVGHGLISMLLGGGFHGVMLDFGGMGWAAFTQPSSSPISEALVLRGGPVSTTLVGFVLLSLAWLLRYRPYISLPLTVVGGQCALEGTSYAFWNAVSVFVFGAMDDGDIGRVVEIYPDLQLPIMIVAGLLMTLSIWSVTTLLLWLIESHVYAGVRLHGAGLRSWAIAVSLIPASTWFLFDWNLLLPGMRHWPNVAAVALHLLAGATLVFKRPGPERAEASWRSLAISISVGFGLLIVFVTAIGVWLRHGVMW